MKAPVYMQSLQKGLVITVKPWLDLMVSWGWKDQTDSERLNVIDRCLGDRKYCSTKLGKNPNFTCFCQAEYWRDEKDGRGFCRGKKSWKQGSKWRVVDCNYRALIPTDQLIWVTLTTRGTAWWYYGMQHWFLSLDKVQVHNYSQECNQVISGF